MTLIWLVFPEQYFGAWTPQKVKDRVTEVLYGWTLWLKEEQKIQEAYRMLKKQGLDATRTQQQNSYFCAQTIVLLSEELNHFLLLFVVAGIVKKDPKLPETLIMAPPPQRTEDSVFDQEDKAAVCICIW